PPRRAAARAASTGAAPASRAARRCSARRAAARTARRARPSDTPLAVLLDELAVDPELAPAAQVLDHVPVDGAPVAAAEVGEAGADREVDGAVDLLVEERVLHVPPDAAVAADPELAEPARTLVRLEHGEQEVAAVLGAGLDDPPAPELEPRGRHLATGEHGRVLGEGDVAVDRV